MEHGKHTTRKHTSEKYVSLSYVRICPAKKNAGQEETHQTAVSALLLISFLCENKKKLC